MITGSTDISSSVRIRQIVLLSYGSFILIGVLNTFLGPALPVLSARWQLNDAQAGSLFFAQFSGALIGSAATGWLLRRLSLAHTWSCFRRHGGAWWLPTSRRGSGSIGTGCRRA